jgi:hypothetical protein
MALTEMLEVVPNRENEIFTLNEELANTMHELGQKDQ